jgi:cell division protein ZapB
MSESSNNQAIELNDLERSLDQLIAQYTAVQAENRMLTDKQDELLKEKANLIEKTNLARTRINDMIARLKAMEQG